MNYEIFSDFFSWLKILGILEIRIFTSMALRISLARYLTKSSRTSNFFPRFRSSSTFAAADIKYDPTPSPKSMCPKEELTFGTTFSDHMLQIDWTAEHGWEKPTISAYDNLSISPASSGLHYGLQCFEGMKAYR